MIIKGRSPTMRHVSRTHGVALDWLFDRINLDLKIKHTDTKNQLEDILTKGNFTCDEWNHLLCLFDIRHFRFINSVKAMSKRQDDAGEERVTAKSRPRGIPNVLASTASESPESQNVPLSSLNVQPRSTGRLVMGARSSNYSEWNIDENGLLKCGNLVKSRTQVRGDPYMKSLSSMMIWTLTPPQNRTFL